MNFVQLIHTPTINQRKSYIRHNAYKIARITLSEKNSRCCHFTHAIADEITFPSFAFQKMWRRGDSPLEKIGKLRSESVHSGLRVR
jgi:hypothetical protein